MTTETRARHEAVKNNALEHLNGQALKLLGEILTWDAAGPHTYSVVKQALTDSGLDAKILRERLPRYAFARACKTLEEGRVIDVLRDDPDEMLFQFSKRFLAQDSVEGGDQFEYRKELKLALNKSSGKLDCKDEEMRQKAQSLLDENIVKWTTGDVSGLVNRLFDKNADLMPIRSAGGAYFVPIQHQGFILRVAEFLARLGGKVNRFPVPEGTQHGDLTVQQCVGDYLNSLVGDHEQAVQNLTLSSRASTIEEQAERINATRVKVEAYANYLADRKDQLLRAVEEARGKLQAKIAALAGDRKAALRLEALQGQEVGSPWDKILTQLEGWSTPRDLFQLCEGAGLGVPSLILYRDLDKLMAKAVEQGWVRTDNEGGYSKGLSGD